jgi:hypothetical protein
LTRKSSTAIPHDESSCIQYLFHFSWVWKKVFTISYGTNRCSSRTESRGPLTSTHRAECLPTGMCNWRVPRNKCTLSPSTLRQSIRSGKPALRAPRQTTRQKFTRAIAPTPCEKATRAALSSFSHDKKRQLWPTLENPCSSAAASDESLNASISTNRSSIMSWRLA